MARKTSKRQKSQKNHEVETPKTRRDALKSLALYGVGGAALLGGGGAFALDFRNKLLEADLSRIGNGRPSVVQIHDPQCALCTSLQKEARHAFKLCSDTDAQFLVANVRSTTGAEFQNSMGLPHVTLVFFSETGRHLGTIEGVTPAEQIKEEMNTAFS